MACIGLPLPAAATQPTINAMNLDLHWVGLDSCCRVPPPPKPTPKLLNRSRGKGSFVLVGFG